MMLTTGDRFISQTAKAMAEIRKRPGLHRPRKPIGAYRFPTLSEDNERYFHSLVPDNSWKDHRCFIVGGGPSLKDFNFSQLKGELVIGINRAFEKMDCTVLFSMDPQYLYWVIHHRFGLEVSRKFKEFKGYRVWLRTRKWAYPQGIFLVNSVGVRPLSYSMKKGLASGANSGFAALNLAVCLGVNPIYLLGFDMKGDENERQAWWHTGYMQKRSATVYDRFNVEFENVAPELKDRGIKVINLNRDSNMKCFEFGDIDSIKRFKMPIFISYYTENTGYAEEVKRLIASLRRFNLEYDIEAIGNLGGWQKNTQYKASFIKKMLLKHKRSVVFIDADARILRYPSLFRNFKADIGAHYREKRELLSGTLYVGYNEKTLALVDKWIELNKANPAIWEQKNLQGALRDFGGSIGDLPAQYCKIYDIMRTVKEPVIEHYQASRRLKRTV